MGKLALSRKKLLPQCTCVLDGAGGREEWGFSTCFSPEILAYLPTCDRMGGTSALPRVTLRRIDDSVTYGCF